MAPSTRQTVRESTPPRHIRTGEYDTIKRTRIFTAYDAAIPFTTLRKFCKQEIIPKTTMLRMLDERRRLGAIACRRQRKTYEGLGRPSTIDPTIISTALHAPQIQRIKLLQHQMNALGLSCHKTTFQRALKKNTKGAKMFKARYRQKKLSAKNRQERIEYAVEHQHHTVDNYFQYVTYTDEAHFCENESPAPLILREEGTADEPENVVERGQKETVSLHIAGWVNWHAKCDKLEFYNDEEVVLYVPDMRKKPRRSKYDDDASWQERLRVWEAEIPHRRISEPKGNGMTQKYYVERLLPVYVDAINTLQSKHRDAIVKTWYLQEDNDSSHGHNSKDGLATQFKKLNCITTIKHPGNSPDLNPIESIWSI